MKKEQETVKVEEESKMKNKIELKAIIGTILLLILLVVLTVVVVISNRTIHSKNEQIKDLNQEIGEYQAIESFWEDYIDLIETIYEGKINEAVLEERVKWLENKKSEIAFDMFDNYWLVEIVSREPFGDVGYYYRIKVVGTSDYTYQVSSELFSIGELALVIELEYNQTFMIDFNN